MNKKTATEIIPYFFWDEQIGEKTDNWLVKICPECDARIQEKQIKGGNYVKHWTDKHAARTIKEKNN